MQIQVIGYFDPSLVAKEHQNHILIAVVFKLAEGAKSKTDQEKHIEIKSFPYQIFNEDRASYLNLEMKKIYHHMMIKYYDETQTDYWNLHNFQSIVEKNPDLKNWTDLPLSEQIFLKFRETTSVGCGHYIRGCKVECSICKQFFSCRFCHDEEVDDHEFQRYDTQNVQCRYCDHIQSISLQCAKCGQIFGNYYCSKCRLICGTGIEAKPNYHCDGCKICMVGIQQFSKHCDKCESCFNFNYFDQHKCTKTRSECIVCFGDMKKTQYGRMVLNCDHQLHTHCYSQLLNNNVLKCPICKKFLPTDQEREQILKWMTNIYNMLVIPLEYEGYIIRVKCNDCLSEFPQHFHPYSYYCPKCQLFNCEEINDNRILSKQSQKQDLKVFESQYPDMLKANHCTVLDVKRLIEYNFSISIDKLEEMLDLQLDSDTVGLFGQTINKMPKSIEEFVAFCLSLAGKLQKNVY